MVAASLSKASAAAWRRMKCPATTALLQHTLAVEGTTQKINDFKSATPTARAPPRLLADRPTPPVTLRPHRTYSSGKDRCLGSGRWVVGIPVKSLRPKNAIGNKVYTLKQGVRSCPLFRKVRGHALIPDEANAWIITKHGLAFFHTLAVLIYYNNQHLVSVAKCLNEEYIRISSKCGSAEFTENAKGLSFDGQFKKGEAFRSFSELGNRIINKYYAGAKLPELSKYFKYLEYMPDHPTMDQEEFAVFNAAFLSPSSAISFINRADSWLRRSGKYKFRKEHGAVSRRILQKYAQQVVGENGETLSDIAMKDVLLSRSQKIKGEHQLNHNLLQGFLNRPKEGGSNEAASNQVSMQPQPNEVSTQSLHSNSSDVSTNPTTFSQPLCSQGSVPGSQGFLNLPKKGGSNQATPNQLSLQPQPKQVSIQPQANQVSTQPLQGHSSDMSSNPTSFSQPLCSQGSAPGSQGSAPGAQLISEVGENGIISQHASNSQSSPSQPPQGAQGSAPGAQPDDSQLGDDLLGSQRDIFVHIFDAKMHRDPAVAALIKGRVFTVNELAEYIRWRLEISLSALQHSFLSQHRHEVLDMQSLFWVDRIGYFSPGLQAPWLMAYRLKRAMLR